MHNFKELKVWQEAMKLAKDIIIETRNFPTEEKYGLVSQLRRASVSIPSNIAEGTSRTSSNEFKRFLEIALGSAFELKTQSLLSRDVAYLSSDKYEQLKTPLAAIQKMTLGLKNKIQNKE